MIFFYWLVAIMPLEEHWLWGHVLWGSFTVTKALGLLCLIIAVCRIGAGDVSLRRFCDRKVRWFSIFIVILGLSTIKSLPQSLSGAYSHVLSVISLFITVSAMVRSRIQLTRTLLTAIGAAGFASLYTIRQQQHYGAGISGFRAGGMSNDSNYYALLVGLWIPLAFLWAFSRRPMWERIFCFVSMGAMLLGSTVAASRGGLIALFASFLYLIARSRRPIRSLLVATALMIPLLVFLPSSLLQRFTHPSDSDRFGQEARLIAWRSGARMIQAHPITGVGLHNFEAVILQYEDPAWSTRLTDYRPIVTLAHNTYIELASEAGLPAVIVFLALILTTLRRLEHIRRRAQTAGRDHLAIIALGLQAGLLSFAVSAFFLTAWWQKMSWLLISLALCLDVPRGRVVALGTLQSKKSGTARQSDELRPLRPVT
jgi:O-antigen ligase